MSNYSNQDKILEILHNDCRLPLEEISVMTGIAAQRSRRHHRRFRKKTVLFLGYGAKIKWIKRQARILLLLYRASRYSAEKPGF